MTKRNAIGLAQSFDLRFDSLPSSAFNVNDTRRSCLSGLVPMADVPPEPSAYWIVSVQWAHCSPTEMEVRTGGSILSSPAVAFGSIYVGSDDCNLYSLIR